MKETDFFKKLNQELRDIPLPMSDKLKNEPIKTQSAQTENQSVRFFRRKRFIAALSAAAAVVVACSIGIFAALTKTPAPLPPLYACMYIDINPSIAITLDENYKVKKAVSRNRDADTMTSDKAFISSLVGTNAENAAVKIADRAAKSGYIPLYEKGNEKQYNQVTVTVKSNCDVPEEKMGTIRESLVEYFCENGIYVYVNAVSETDTETEKLSEAIEACPETYFELIAKDKNKDELQKLTEESVYAYASELLDDALRKYDLFKEIRALNEQIKSDPDNVFMLGYWLVNENLNENIRAISYTLSFKLEELYIFYGTDCRERNKDSLIRFTAAYTAYNTAIGLADIDELRNLAENGLSDETFGGLENLSVRVNYFCFVSNDVLNDIATEIWNGTVAAAETLLNDLISLTRDKARALTEKYTALFDLERERIEPNDYAEFLERIGK